MDYELIIPVYFINPEDLGLVRGDVLLEYKENLRYTIRIIFYTTIKAAFSKIIFLFMFHIETNLNKQQFK